MSNYEELTAESLHASAIEAQEMNSVAVLKPRVFIDNNLWCVLLGENIQDGIVGYGETPRLAVFAFNKAWDRQLPAASSPRATVDDAMVSRAHGRMATRFRQDGGTLVEPDGQRAKQHAAAR